MDALSGIDLSEVAANYIESSGDLVVESVVKAAVNKLLSTQWKKEVEDGRAVIEKISSDSVLQQYCERIALPVLNVRTIASPEVDVNIDDIYCPLSLKDKKQLRFLKCSLGLVII